MAIIVDDRARDVIADRLAHGRRATMELSVRKMPHGGRILMAEWASDRPRPGSRELHLGGVTLLADERVARFAQWHDITISGWRLGPFHQFTVEREPVVLLQMVAWERTHPGIARVRLNAGRP